MELTEIEAYADQLTDTLKGTESAAEVRDICFRLEGLAAAAKIKAELFQQSNLGPCMDEAPTLNPARCVLLAGHDGGHSDGEGMTWTKPVTARCGHRWSWPSKTMNHHEICTLAPWHQGPHVNEVTEVSVSKDSQPATEPTKPIADRLHELTSNWKSSADSYESVAREGSTEEAFAVQLRACAGDLEVVLMEGGI